MLLHECPVYRCPGDFGEDTCPVPDCPPGTRLEYFQNGGGGGYGGGREQPSVSSGGGGDFGFEPSRNLRAPLCYCNFNYAFFFLTGVKRSVRRKRQIVFPGQEEDLAPRYGMQQQQQQQQQTYGTQQQQLQQQYGAQQQQQSLTEFLDCPMFACVAIPGPPTTTTTTTTSATTTTTAPTTTTSPATSSSAPLVKRDEDRCSFYGWRLIESFDGSVYQVRTKKKVFYE